VVDYLAGGYDAVVRFNGGSNAGHTVVIGGRKHTFHLIPSGALKGKELLIGAGVALDPVVLKDELSILPESTRDRLVVDGRCTLVSPLDRQLDQLLEETRGESSIGTTRRGIGPAYAMRALRLSPRVMDLVEGFDFSPLIGFYRRLGVDSAGIIAWAEDSKRLLARLEGNVSQRVEDLNEKGGSVLFEASQGTLLDLLHGSYPYVTGTHTIVSYISSALGVPPSSAGDPLGVLKCYTTRVGSGPFPTEVKDKVAEVIRATGNEYGATTGRPRRVGWVDLVALRYALRLNGVTNVAVSKLDVLSAVRDFKACVAYRRLGSETTDFQKAFAHLGEVEPVYESPLSLYGARYGGALPAQARLFVEYLETQLGVHVSLISHGEERSSTIEL
jgi:adenylosuccinate synthase